MTREDALDFEARARRVFGDWRFWTILLVIAVAWLAIWTLHLTLQQADENANRIASQKAQAQTEVTNCFQGVANGPKLVKLGNGLVAIADNSIKANTAALAASAGDPDLNRIRQQSLRRLRPAKANFKAFVKSLKEATPTVTKCKKLAFALHVDPKAIRKGLTQEGSS